MSYSYAYNAALYCDSCANEIIDRLDSEGVADDGTTDTYPQACCNGTESDCPDHCDSCHEFLANDLTDDGRAYVKQALIDHAETGAGDAEVLAEWSSYYGITLEFNFDCADVDELHAYCQDDSNPAALREYAAIKARAIEAREGGRIQTALVWESTCDGLYALLPEGYRW